MYRAISLEKPSRRDASALPLYVSREHDDELALVVQRATAGESAMAVLVSAGIGGRMASAPVTFDPRQWRRQVRAAQGRTAAPGFVPLLARGGRIPVGGTIRAVACRWRPVFTLPAAACGRHMVIIGATGFGNPTHEISDMGCWQAR